MEIRRSATCWVCKIRGMLAGAESGVTEKSEWWFTCVIGLTSVKIHQILMKPNYIAMKLPFELPIIFLCLIFSSFQPDCTGNWNFSFGKLIMNMLPMHWMGWEYVWAHLKNVFLICGSLSWDEIEAKMLAGS